MGASRRSTRPRGSAHSDRRWTAFWLLLPATLGLVVFKFAPIGYALLVSFQEFEFLAGPAGWVGLENYRRLFEDPLFLKAVVTTSLYTAILLWPR